MRSGLAVLLILLAACAGTGGAPAPEGVAPGTRPGAPQVMVMLAPAPPAIWSNTTAELAQSYRLRTVYSWTMGSLGEHCIVYEVTGDREVQDVVRRVASDPRVDSVQAIETFEALAAEKAAEKEGRQWNDPYAHLQHSAEALQLGQAHRWATGKGVRVAVIDTGVDLDHPDLRGRVVKAQNFVDRGERSFTTDIHGTAIAGVIAAAADNEVGIVGVAPQAEIYALKACWQQSPGAREAVCNSYTLAKAVDFAILEGAQVLNFSLAGPPDPLLTRLIKVALERGIVVVAAVPDKDSVRGFPASLQGVIGISGSDPPKGRTSFLAAPAVDILTTVPRGSYDFFSGSSLAAAQASGVVALLLERNPKLTPPQLAALFLKTARANSQIDACAALASAAGTGSCT
ncbi:MAG TPA: S8 family serine peptidase [Thermoanaerobaculia bacterium]|nr:S8 family serine peptidase [Thermoanaerobaculia bacterium]